MARDRYVTWEESTPPPAWAIALVVLVTTVPGAVMALEALRRLAGGEPGAALSGLAGAAGLLLALALFLLLFGRLHVQVTRTSLLVGFGYLPLIQKLVLFDEITDIEPVTYSPLREFGGWGIRWGRRGKKAWTARGNRALRLTLTDGTLLYVGSDDPERLAARMRLVGGGRWDDSRA